MNNPTTTSPMTVEEAQGLRSLIFADGNKTFPDSWLRQGIFFNTIANLRYGLIQLEGGPCGVVACCQGYALRFLMFGEGGGEGAEEQGDNVQDWREPKKKERKR